MEENTRVAIIGYGFVGTATEYLLQEHFAENRFNVEIHDPDKGHVIKASDFAGSTSGMIKYVKDNQPKKVMMVTECSMSDNVEVENPNVQFIKPCNLLVP